MDLQTCTKLMVKHLFFNRCFFARYVNLFLNFIGTFLVIENIILFLNLKKFVYPLPLTFIFSIIELIPSIGPFDNLLCVFFIRAFYPYKRI